LLKVSIHILVCKLLQILLKLLLKCFRCSLILRWNNIILLNRLPIILGYITRHYIHIILHFIWLVIKKNGSLILCIIFILGLRHLWYEIVQRNVMINRLKFQSIWRTWYICIWLIKVIVIANVQIKLLSYIQLAFNLVAVLIALIILFEVSVSIQGLKLLCRCYSVLVVAVFVYLWWHEWFLHFNLTI